MNANDVSQATAKGKQGKVCPYLGLLEDSQTTLSYPSSSNLCYHALPIAPPNLDHQRSFCFGGRQHTLCPVFTRSLLAPLPPDIRLPENIILFGKPVEKRIILPILLACVVLFLGVVGAFWALNGHGGNGNILSEKTRTSTPSGNAIPLATDTFPYASIPVTPNIETPVTPTIATETPTGVVVSPMPTHTLASCGRPASWIVYIVRPGDSLYSLSVAYGVSVAELERANCMGNSTLLHSGQILYVPPWAALNPLPTATAIPTSTLTDTPESSLPSETPTEPSISTSTDTPIATDVPTATPIPTDIPTDTPMPTTS